MAALLSEWSKVSKSSSLPSPPRKRSVEPKKKSHVVSRKVVRKNPVSLPLPTVAFF